VSEESTDNSVSVVVCTWNRATYLRRCLDSLIHQTLQSKELIVVNGPSTDKTSQVIRDYPVTMVQQGDRKGLSEARNLGIARATGDVIAFIDDDAIADPRWIENIESGYSNPKFGGVAGTVIGPNEVISVPGLFLVDQYGDYRFIAPEAGAGREALRICNGCNMSFRKSVLQLVGGFDPFYRYYHDEADLCVRIQRAGFLIDFCPKAVVRHAVAPSENRRQVGYFLARSRAYFSLKNFGNEVGLMDLVLRDIWRLKADFLSVELQARTSGMPVPDRFVTLRELMAGRIDGYLHGIEARGGSIP